LNAQRLSCGAEVGNDMAIQAVDKHEANEAEINSKRLSHN